MIEKSYRHGRVLIVLVFSRRIEWYATWRTWVHTWPHMTLTWGQILIDLTVQSHHLYIRCVLTRGTWWCPNYILYNYIYSYSFLLKSYLHVLPQTGFWPFWHLVPKPLTLAHIWWHLFERAVQELSNASFLSLLPQIVSKIMAHFRSNEAFCIKFLNLPWIVKMDRKL